MEKDGRLGLCDISLLLLVCSFMKTCLFGLHFTVVIVVIVFFISYCSRSLVLVLTNEKCANPFLPVKGEKLVKSMLAPYESLAIINMHNVFL